MATTGVVGQAWRADVTPTGAIEPWDGSARLDWFVAADDRWHDPSTDAGVRHRRIDGAAVFETMVRIPGGDAIQRVWSVADCGGYTLVEVRNDSSLPIAVVITRPDVVATRPPATMPMDQDRWGVETPPGSVVLPVGHRSTVVVGLPHGAAGQVTLPTGLASPDAVVRGWISRTDAASRLDLPDAARVEAVRAARCEALLCGPPDPDDDPPRYLLTLGELVRMNELDRPSLDAAVADVAAAVEAIARGTRPLREDALAAAGCVLARAGERRALRDLQRFMSPCATPAVAHGDMNACGDLNGGADQGIEVVGGVERPIAAGPVLFPGGIPAAWRGADFEAHGLMAGPASRLSLAVRWHGRNVAVLWDVTGDPVALASPTVPGGWSTNDASGESLWVLDGPHTSSGSPGGSPSILRA